MTDSEGRVVEFYLPGVESRVVVQDPEQGAEGTVTLERVVLVPTDNWSEDFIRPTPQCVVGKQGECIELPDSRFTTPQVPAGTCTHPSDPSDKNIKLS